MKVSFYYCQSATEATDRANLYFIASPRAREIEKDGQRKRITLKSKDGKPIAIFAY